MTGWAPAGAARPSADRLRPAADHHSMDLAHRLAALPTQLQRRILLETPNPAAEKPGPAKQPRMAVYPRGGLDAPEPVPPPTRRAVLALGASLGALASTPRGCRADTPAEIYASYSYTSPPDLLPYIYDHAAPGDVDALLAAIDDFGAAFPMYKTGPEKGEILEAVVAAAQPLLAVELGSFVGYGAARIARRLPPGGRLLCVEANPQCVTAMEGVLRHAGLRGRVTIQGSLASDAIPALAASLPGPAQLLFEDHCKACYLPDLRAAEASGLIGPGSWLVADNVLFPGAPDLLAALRDQSSWAAAVVPCAYEYDQPWNPGWEPKQDGMAVAVRVAGLPADAADAARRALTSLCARLGGGCLPA